MVKLCQDYCLTEEYSNRLQNGGDTKYFVNFDKLYVCADATFTSPRFHDDPIMFEQPTAIHSTSIRTYCNEIGFFLKSRLGNVLESNTIFFLVLFDFIFLQNFLYFSLSLGLYFVVSIAFCVFFLQCRNKCYNI